MLQTLRTRGASFTHELVGAPVGRWASTARRWATWFPPASSPPTGSVDFALSFVAPDPFPPIRRTAARRSPAAGGFGATRLDRGDIIDHLRAGTLPARARADDPLGFASGALEFRLQVGARDSQSVSVLVPLRAGTPDVAVAAGDVDGLERQVAQRWAASLRPLEIDLPPSARDVVETLDAQLAWILVNRDGPSIQPGSRSYDRSWIRDGSLTSSALLRLGHADEVRHFIEWFAAFQYEDGKVPCCADARGPDPVTENDSHGQLIYTIAEYHRFTGDRAFVARLWPRVVRAIFHLDAQRAQRRTAEWRAPDKRRYFGLLLPSISHEGYPNPMHSYWDDFFAYRGYADAVYLAGVLGKSGEQTRFAASRDTFTRDLAASVRATMEEKRIDYVPGCAELGDFDATSTTVALAPTAAADVLPDEAVRRTFERYWRFFDERRSGRAKWDAFTPYEVRTIGSFVRLGWRDRANAALRYFLAHRRTAGWRQWSEVEHRDLRAPRFLGDIPHTWVGSDYVRSVLDLFAYDRPADSAWVVARGVPLAWAREAEGLRVSGLATPFGTFGYRMRAFADRVEVAIDGGFRPPPGGVVVEPPGDRPFASASIDGEAARLEDGRVTVRVLPAKVVFRYGRSPNPGAPYGAGTASGKE